MSRNSKRVNIDPRTQYVPEKYSFLATDFMATTKQNKEYWNSVKVPMAPSSRISFEEFRQVAVFVPLIPVVMVCFFVGKIAAAFAFLVALLLMRNLHLKVQRDIGRKWNEWLDRDQGRYAFTQFMCKEFNLRPQDVTLELVDRMCSHFLLLVDARRRLEMEKKSPTSISHRKYDLSSAFVDERIVGTRRTERDEYRPNQNDCNLLGENVFLRSNPVTGLPMMDDCFDIHGNTFATSNMDDMWSNSDNNGFAASNDFVNSGSAGFSDDTNM